MNIRSSTRRLVLLSVFSAIILALGLPGSPLHFLGFPTIGPINATTLHIPVILGAVLEGPLFGGILGLVMGLTSFLTALLAPNVSAPFFLRPEISILPRILIGLVAAGVYRLLRKKMNGSWAAGIAAVCATLTNTVLVVGLITWRGAVGSVDSQVWTVIRSAMGVVVSVNGVAELILAVLITVALERALAPIIARQAANAPSQRK
jgi:uncharacterized membrane protein